MGYYNVEPEAITDSYQKIGSYGTIYGFWLVPEKTTLEVRDIMKPLEAAVAAAVPSGQATIAYSPTVFTDFWEYEQHSPYGGVGVEGRLGSRLFDQVALVGNHSNATDLWKQTTPLGQKLLGHLVAGPGPRKAVIPGGSNAVLPAWRKAFAHIGES